MFAANSLGRFLSVVDGSPWGAASGRHSGHPAPRAVRPGCLYTAEERKRRDTTPWTMVQGILAPVQFMVFLMSLFLVLRFLTTGHGETAATASIVVKTITLYTIMVTGAIWEKQVFGRYLFAPAFYWEDVFSMLVLALHTAYLAALFSGTMQPRDQMLLALAGYTAYLVNATQFVLKLRAARREPANNPAFGSVA
jgi:3-vinyl bacteriochlorophyllide hydratase